MDRQNVESSNLESVGYDTETQMLEVEFKDGRIYQYDNVPITVYNNLMEADSPGGYFNRNIKYGYSFVPVA